LIVRPFTPNLDALFIYLSLFMRVLQPNTWNYIDPSETACESQQATRQAGDLGANPHPLKSWSGSTILHFGGTTIQPSYNRL